MSEQKKDHDACAGKPESEEDMSSERRNFLRQAGKAGLAAGFAHFLLVGENLQKVQGACDTCSFSGGGYTDVCKPSNNDPDICFSAPLEMTDKDDECPDPRESSGDVCFVDPEQGLSWGDNPNHD